MRQNKQAHLNTLVASMSSARSVRIHWFRKGLRLHDNPALCAAVNGETPAEVRPVFVLDPHFVEKARVGANRWRFLQQSLADLDAGLRKRGGRLFVVRGKPEEVFPKLFEDWNVKILTYEVDTEPYADIRDAKIRALAKEAGVEVISKVSHTLFNPGAIIRKNSGRPPLTYQGFLKAFGAMGSPPKEENLDEKKLKDGLKCSDAKLMKDQKYNVPTLKDLRVKEDELGECLYPGGETAALERLDKYISETNAKWVVKFEKPNTSPNSLEPSTTVLSPYLKFGCLSPRKFYWRLKDVEGKKKCSQPPVSLMGQLLWREFYYTCAAATDNFHQMKGNPICKQIDWDTNKSYLDAWTHARTGYLFVDAIMTQLRQEGWIHHLARHMVACFLTRGDLYISWEEGLQVFEELLLDADYALNAGNWMWLSASAFFHQYYRVYSPVAFGKKTDKSGQYIRKYLPKLKKFPDEYIYEPWKAPKSVQEAAGCVIGKDYPKPIVDHDTVHKANIQRMKAAYAKGSGKGEKRKADGTAQGAAAKIQKN